MRTLSWLAIHELDTWFVGARPVELGELPRYVVRVTVTAGALTEPKRAHVVEAVTRVLAEADADRSRLYKQPEAWIHLVEVPDGGWGTCGRVMGHAGIVDLIRSRRAALKRA